MTAMEKKDCQAGWAEEEGPDVEQVQVGHHNIKTSGTGLQTNRTSGT